MFDLLLSDEGGVAASPRYMRLYRNLRRLIEDGTIPDGAKLPSVRTLRVQLKVSAFTVESAYQLLVAEGYAYSKPKSGFIAVRPRLERVNRLVERQALAVLSGESERAKKDGGDEERTIDFNLLTVDRDSFPAKAWRSALASAMTRYGANLHGYGDSRGELPLRESLARYLAIARGVNCGPEQIVIGTGFSYSLSILKGLWGQAGNIAFEDESIAQIGHAFNAHGYRAVSWQEESPVQAAYLTPSHRPSGMPFTNEMKDGLLQWAIDRDAYLIEDDYDGEFRYRGKPTPSLQGADAHDRVIYLGTFSKAFTPALRMNYMVLPVRLAEKLSGLASLLSCPSRIDQLAMHLFMERGHWARHLKRMKKKYRNKGDYLLGRIEGEWKDCSSVSAEIGGLQVELAIRTSFSSERLIRLASDQGIRVYGAQWSSRERRDNGEADGSVGDEPSDTRIYLGFGGLSEDEIALGIKRLKRAWEGAMEQPLIKA